MHFQKTIKTLIEVAVRGLGVTQFRPSGAGALETNAMRLPGYHGITRRWHPQRPRIAVSFMEEADAVNP